jgi:hypothetical protein
MNDPERATGEARHGRKPEKLRTCQLETDSGQPNDQRRDHKPYNERE